MRVFRPTPSAAHRELAEREEHNAVAATCIEKRLLAKEPALFSSKWFDYRFMTPMEATKRFFEEFTSTYRHIWDRRFDSASAHQKLGHAPISFEQGNAELSSFWCARQFADEHCVPYERFVYWAIEGFVSHGYKRIPRPNQLYALKHRKLVSDGIERLWRERRDAVLEISELPHYREEAFKKLPAQIAHRDWIVDSIKRLPSSSHALMRVCFESPRLSTERAIEEFGKEQVAYARSYAPKGPPKPACFNIADLLPGCYGLPGAHDPDTPACRLCPVVTRCGGATEQTLERVIRGAGVADPADARRRELQRERTRRFRARKRVPSGATTSP